MPTIGNTIYSNYDLFPKLNLYRERKMLYEKDRKNKKQKQREEKANTCNKYAFGFRYYARKLNLCVVYAEQRG